MAKRDVLSPALLRQLIDYNPDTGVLRWRRRTPDLHSATGADPRKTDHWNRLYAGEPCFTSNNGQGYLVGCMAGRMYRAHRIAWAIHYGTWPQHMLDHKNQKRQDNRIANLREVDFVENGRNARRQQRNYSGQVGVQWKQGAKRWRARITVNHRKIELGTFKDFDEAVAVRKAAEREYGFSPLHGRSK